MKKPPKRLTAARRLQLREIISAYNSENFRRAEELLDEAPDWFRDWPLWSAGENMPGYMPDSAYTLCMTERAARSVCRDLERDGAFGAGYVTDIIPTSLREVMGGGGTPLAAGQARRRSA